MTNVCITAGFDKALNALAIAELLRRKGVFIAAILVVNPYSLIRLRGYLRQRGSSFLYKSVRRLLGQKSHHQDAMLELLESEGIRQRSLKAWCRDHDVPYHLLNSLNDEISLSLLKRYSADWVVYGGGGILKKGFIEASRGRVLNAHAGPLPEVRGMNACEWSLLLGHAPYVTIHLIDRGIDTGGIIRRLPISIDSGDTIESLRVRATAIGVMGLVDAVLQSPTQLPPANQPCSRQCYVLAPALRELLEQRLERSQGKEPAPR